MLLDMVNMVNILTHLGYIFYFSYILWRPYFHKMAYSPLNSYYIHTTEASIFGCVYSYYHWFWTRKRTHLRLYYLALHTYIHWVFTLFPVIDYLY